MNTSEAALFRAISADPTPCLLLDEVDAIYGAKAREREDLRAMLNAGFRQGAVVRRMGGKTMTELQTFEVFAPKVLSGIGSLPDTISDRAIPIRLERRTRQEKVERFRRRDAIEEADPLSRSASNWGEFHLPHLAELRPALPDELDDRAQDMWEPLLAIADRAGGAWPDRARKAALVLSANQEVEDDSHGVRVLVDLAAIFDEKEAAKMSSASLVDALAAREESPWGEWRHGKPLSPNGLARLLKRYHIRPKTIRLGDETPKGYEREQFKDAFARYLPSQAATSPQPAPLSEEQAISTRNGNGHVAGEKQGSIPLVETDVALVAAQNRGERPAGVEVAI